MKITADGMVCEIKHGESLLDAVKKLELDMFTLRHRPLAAQIGGEVFSLRYTPFRDVEIHLLRYGEDMGRRVYERTLQFIFIAAVRRLFPSARVCVRYTLGPGLYITIEKENGLNEQDVLKLESEMRNIVRAAIPLERKRLDIKEAISFYEQDGQLDKAKLLKWRKFSYFDVYTIGSYMDYFYGEMAPSTDYADVFRLKYLEEGAVLLLMPRSDEPDVPSDYEPLPKLAVVFRQSNMSREFIEGDDNESLGYIKTGSLLHNVLSRIRTIADIDIVVNEMEMEGLIDRTEISKERILSMLHKRLADSRVCQWFTSGWKLYNECTLLHFDHTTGELTERRPDRVITNGNRTIVIDFKFGNSHAEYHDQVREYIQQLRAMGHADVTGYLWYVYQNNIEKVEA